MPWQTIVAIQLLAGNSIINTSGMFVYTGTPANGNLLFSAAPAAGTDQFNNAFKAGATVYGSAGSFEQLFTSSGLASLIMSTGDASEFKTGLVTTEIVGAGGTRQLETFVSSPNFSIGNPADIALISESFDGTVNSQINLDCANRVVFGVSQNAWWSDALSQLLFVNAGSGPFINGETFHTVSLPGTGGFSGTIRVKKLPWNMVALDYALKWTNTTGGTFTAGSLPDATYYPTVSTPRRFPMGTGGTPTGDAQAGLFVPASGALSVFVNASVGGSTDFASGTFTYPTN